MKQPVNCVIIGAGISGLMAAQALQAKGINVALFDKGRSVGGRLATRWIETDENEKGYFDHGAQFFTVREPRFQSWVDGWLADGIVSEWSRGFANASALANNDGHTRYRGNRGMNAIARHLATNLHIQLTAKVEHLSRVANQWQVKLENGDEAFAETLILTPPVPQSLALLDAGACELPAAVRFSLEGLTYDPCFAVLAVLAAPARLPEPGALQLNQEPIAWIADNHRKGISPDAFTVTIHAGPEFTRQYWDAAHEIIARKLLHAASEWLRAPIKSWQVHRWRYSQPQVTYPDACLGVDVGVPLVFAGDAFGAPRVEGAAMSGLAAAEKVMELLRLGEEQKAGVAR